MSIEHHEYQADAKQVLDLMVHSLYTNREIFLRELISNASDALDRLRFEALTKPELLRDIDNLEIRVSVDADRRILTVTDTGIGMSRDEVISNIGTIARSGSAELRKSAAPMSDPSEKVSLIGQFGVGFYSVFMVADEVTLTTRRAGELGATRWKSNGDGTYEIEDCEKETRGTEITLHLRPPDPELGIDDYCDRWRIGTIVTRHSDFITYPIFGQREVESGGEVGNEKTITIEDHVLNSRISIWKLSPSEVSDEQYRDFYRHITHDWDEPVKRIVLKADGIHEYQALLFVPSKASHDLYYHGCEWGLRLLTNSVVVIDRCPELLPRYLRFVRGAVFCIDLPLNISRQRLQQDSQVAQMRKWLSKKILGVLQSVADEEPERYLELWNEFGRSIKEGVLDDYTNRDRILPLLRFASSNHPQDLTTLKDYVGRMKPGQEDIFYLTGESRNVVEASPHLEQLRDRGLEVLYLTDGVDELITQRLHDFEGKKLKSAGKGDLSFDMETDGNKTDWAEVQTKFASLLSAIERALEAYVRSVRITQRLKSSAACLVVGAGEYSPTVERILGRNAGVSRRSILELNPWHPIVISLLRRFNNDPQDPEIANQAELLLGAASLAGGSELPNRERFGSLLYEVMERSIAASLSQ